MVGDGNLRNLVAGIKEERTKRQNWKWEHFGGHIEPWYKGNSQVSTRMTQSKTTINKDK